MNISLPKLLIILLYCAGLISEKTNKNISGISTKSNNDIRPHMKAIKTRWNMEECFRTCKQSLEMSKNQYRNINMQINHIYSVLLNYSLLEIQRKKKKLKTQKL